MSGSREKKAPPLGEYEIGYRRPPASGRFQKGKSGNPAGRPRQRHDFDSRFRQHIDATVIIKHDGVELAVSKRVLGPFMLIQKALNGDRGSMRRLVKLMREIYPGDKPEAIRAVKASAQRRRRSKKLA